MSRTGRVGHGKGRQFSKKVQPKGKRGPRKKVSLGGTGKWDEAEIYRLAELGVEASDVAHVLGLQELLQADQAKTRIFEEVVARGHSHHRARVAMLMRAEAEKGRSNPLIKLTSVWIDRYSEGSLSGDEEVGIVERLGELVMERKEHRKSVAAATV